MYRIVIADDEKMIREGLINLDWKKYGMEIIGVARNGIEAEEIIDSEIFDILLTDIKMPGISGLELAKNLNTSNPLAKTILLSGYGEFSYAQRAISLGVYDYILKPSSPEQIITCVKSACKKIEEERQKGWEVEKLKSKLDNLEEVLGTEKVLEEKERNTDIQDILRYIYANYAENLTLSVLANHFYFSTVYMSSYIKRFTGHTFLEILTSVRMYHTARLLRETKFKNREIGMRVGIPDERYLGQVFKKVFGMTPYEYRKSNRKSMESLEEFIRRMSEK